MAIAIEEMSARTADAKFAEKAKSLPDLIVSADSHVDEPVTLWDGLPSHIKDKLPQLVSYPPDKRPQGGLDPKQRLIDMDRDGVAAEVLYPTMTLRAFAAPKEAQEAGFRLYNDWLAEYCATAPKRLFGVPAICIYDVDAAIKEMHRCLDMGLTGALLWQVPDPKLPILSDHYEKFWAAAAEADQVVNFHILTGHNYKLANPKGIEKIRGSVNIKTQDAVTTVYDMIWSGVFDRHPKLKVEIVEAEIGWLPFMIQQWDYYFKRFSKPGPAQEQFAIDRLPSEIFNEHFYATFMDDFVGAQALKFWGDKNCMWSSDYPHANMTWPNSRTFLARQIGDLEPARQKRLLSQNVIDLYKLKL